MLCKHEVVGSIPSGSTRSLDRPDALPCVERVGFVIRKKSKFRRSASWNAVLIYIVKREFVRIVRKGYAQAAGLTARRWTDSEENWS